MEKGKKEENSEKNKNELLKEVLRRANEEERQQLEAIAKRQIAIAKRMHDIQSEQDILTERRKKNEYPESKHAAYTLKTTEEILKMNSEETNQWSTQIDKEIEEHSSKFNVRHSEDTAITNGKFKLAMEFIDLKQEFDSLEDKEKWLLLSIALRSQPNLLKYLETGDRK